MNGNSVKTSPTLAVAVDLGDTLLQHKKKGLKALAREVRLLTGAQISVKELESAIYEEWRQAIGDEGSPKREKYKSICEGNVEQEFISDLFKNALASLNVACVPQSLINSFVMMETSSEFYKKIPGVVETLKVIKERNLILILISNAFPYAKRLIKDHNLEVYFDYLILSFEVGSIKPESEIYQELLRVIGLPPEAVLFIDDRLVNIKAAEAVGMRTAWFNSHQEDSEDCKGCQIKNFRDLIHMIDVDNKSDSGDFGSSNNPVFKNPFMPFNCQEVLQYNNAIEVVYV